jgi:hypothetical protein
MDRIRVCSPLNATALWHIEPCSLVEIDRSFGDAYGLHHQGGDSPDD